MKVSLNWIKQYVDITLPADELSRKLTMAGFEVKDLGKDIEPEAFVEAVKEFEPDVLGMSALLTTTMRSMEHTIKALEEAGVRDKVKVMIGGAPVTQSFCDQIGADGYASNAAAAADLAKKFVS